MTYRIFFGMRFEDAGLRFEPFVPEAYQGSFKLSNFNYRNSILTIELKGYGNKIESIQLDGQKLEDATIPADLNGEHNIVIQMAPSGGINIQNKFNLVANHFAPDIPRTYLKPPEKPEDFCTEQ